MLSLLLAFRAPKCASTPAMDLPHLWEFFCFDFSLLTKMNLHKAVLHCFCITSLKLSQDPGGYCLARE